MGATVHFFNKIRSRQAPGGKETCPEVPGSKASISQRAQKLADETAQKPQFSSKEIDFPTSAIKSQGYASNALNRISKWVLCGQLLALGKRKSGETFPLTRELCARKNTGAKKTLADRLADSKLSWQQAFRTSWTVQLTRRSQNHVPSREPHLVGWPIFWLATRNLATS